MRLFICVLLLAITSACVSAPQKHRNKYFKEAYPECDIVNDMIVCPLPKESE